MSFSESLVRRNLLRISHGPLAVRSPAVRVRIATTTRPRHWTIPAVKNSQEAFTAVVTPLLHVAASLVVVLSNSAPALAEQPRTAAIDAQYEQLLRKREQTAHHNMTSSSGVNNGLQLDEDLFTHDAWEGMVRLQDYNSFVDQQCRAEQQPGCEQCTANRQILEKVWQVVANEFYDPLGHFKQSAWAQQLLAALKESGGVLRDKNSLYSAAQRMVSQLGDRYSAFLPPSQFRMALRRPLPVERSYLAAQFVGVGLQLGAITSDGGRIVEAPLASSPAEEAGVMRGDRVLEIAGMSAEALTMDETTALLRGPTGSTVDLLLAPSSRPGNTRSLSLERRALPQPAVKEAQLATPTGGSVTYLRLHYFSHDTTQLVRSAIERGEEEGVSGYILDLRNNPGGTFEEAVSIAALFLDPSTDIAATVNSGEVVDDVFKVGALPEEIFPDHPGPLTSRPVLLLVNRASASASEVLAGALHDNHRAELIGERTFGKGVLQYYYPMTDGSGVKLTVAKYLTPAKYDIVRRGGLRPDIPCSDYPHGIFTSGTADRCVLQALDSIETQLHAPVLLNYSPLYASTPRSTAQN